MLDGPQQVDDVLEHAVDRLSGRGQQILQLLRTNVHRLHLVDLAFDLQCIVEIFGGPRNLHKASF